MRSYKYYLFDIDRTLWAFDANAKSALFYLIDRFDLKNKIGMEDKEEFFTRYEEINTVLWQRYERGEITKETLRAQRFHDTFLLYCKENGKEETFGTTLAEQQKNIRAFGETFGEAYLQQMPLETKLEPGADLVLKTLKERGCRVAVVSNGFKEVQYRKLRNSNIIQYIDAFLISEEVGIHKPCPVIFKRAVEALCGAEAYLNPEQRREIKRQTLMVGDDFTNDIEGAQVFGIDQFYYNPYHKPCEGGPTYESDNLMELIDLSPVSTSQAI